VYIRRQLSIALKWLPLFMLVPLLVAIPTYFLTSSMRPTYEASARLVVGSAPNASPNDLLTAQQLAAEYGVLAGTREFARGIVEGKDWGWTEQDLLERVSVTSAANSPTLTVTVSDSDPERAAEVANAVAAGLLAMPSPYPRAESDALSAVDGYLASIREEITDVQARIDDLLGQPSTVARDVQIDALYARMGSLRGTYAQLLPLSSAGIVHQLASLEQAIAPSGPTSPRVLLFTILAAVVGFVIAGAIAFVLEFLNDKPSTDAEVEAATGLRVLGHIAERRRDVSHTDARRLVMLHRPQSVEAEAYRNLRARIGFLSRDTDVKTILVTGTTAGSEKAVVAANLALAYAQQGSRVVLVDADIRRPSVHTLFGVKNDTGLSMLRAFDPQSLSNTARFVPNSGLRVLTAGPSMPDAIELLNPTRVQGLLEALLVDNELVILDGPPLMRDSDAAVMSSMVDGTVVVAPGSDLDVGELQVARSVLTTAHAKALGVVLHRPVRRSPGAVAPLVDHTSAVEETVGSPATERLG
jgi:capsular exopolysaccharide synthesis family protein